MPEHLRVQHPGTYFRSGSASPLGWGVGCALGLALAEPGKTSLVAVGDDVFLLSPMLGALLTSMQRAIPLVILILNNGSLRLIAQATREFYPNSVRDLPLTYSNFESVELHQCARFVDGWGAVARTPSELHAALLHQSHLFECHEGRTHQIFG